MPAPISLRRTDLGIGKTEAIDLSCGATRDDRCPSCAQRAQRLRKVQIRDGWHRTDEPAPAPKPTTEGHRALISLRASVEHMRDLAVRASEWDQVTELDDAIGEVEQAITGEGLRGTVASPHGADEPAEPKRQRSTRRRQDAPNLPRQKVQPRTVGRVYTAPDGAQYRPSMWMTMTLVSHGTYETLEPAEVARFRALNAGSPVPFRDRTRAEVAAFFDGLDLVEPGIVPVSAWRDENRATPRPPADQVPYYAAVAVVP